MIEWHPRVKYDLHGSLYAVDGSGSFDFDDLVTAVSGLHIDAGIRLRSIRTIQVPAGVSDVLLNAHEHPLILCNDFTTGGPCQTKVFLRTESTAEEEPTKFTSVADILDNPDEHTSYIRELVDFIPANELSEFGIESLKRIVK